MLIHLIHVCFLKYFHSQSWYFCRPDVIHTTTTASVDGCRRLQLECTSCFFLIFSLLPLLVCSIKMWVHFNCFFCFSKVSAFERRLTISSRGKGDIWKGPIFLGGIKNPPAGARILLVSINCCRRNRKRSMSNIVTHIEPVAV